jgi:Glycine zipper
MKNILFALVATFAIAGCTTAERTATVGALGGAAIGGIAGGDIEGAAVGAAIGGVGGYLLGRAADRPGYCRYRDRYTGRVYVERC